MGCVARAQVGAGWGPNGMLRNGMGPGMGVGMPSGLGGLANGLAGLSLNEQYGMVNGMVGDNQALLNSIGLNNLAAGGPGSYMLPGMQDPAALAAANPLLANSIATSLANGGLDGMALSAGLAAMPPGGLSALGMGAQMPGAAPGGGIPHAPQGYSGGGEGMGNGGSGPGGGPMGANPNRAQADAQALQNLSKLSAAGRAGGGPGGGYSPTGARLWGQKIGSNDKFNEWKLFIGQVPLEVRGSALCSSRGGLQSLFGSARCCSRGPKWRDRWQASSQLTASVTASTVCPRLRQAETSLHCCLVTHLV